ncbi:hypothetical protein [Pseudoalteromonas denitrificans]|uniref:Uncharacterized protein n=1 Tax=Pseudoalteromonas denitrificans DSM 6059 TaxID=1123010 RepID=A0A1I1TS77_9GAMM|nr:hypothetical protein [Pseudoalteromonas denitrificans]SFD61432.1 hypothetical protein SAMN02745724_04977 [Pseudoalteromonas denitrificans DSM 6059]
MDVGTRAIQEQLFVDEASGLLINVIINCTSNDLQKTILDPTKTPKSLA